MSRRVRELETLALARMSGGVEWGEDDMELQRRMDGVMGDGIGILHKAQEKVIGRPQLEAKNQSRMKWPGSEELQLRARQLKLLHRMLRAESRGGFKTARRISAFFRAEFGIELREPGWRWKEIAKATQGDWGILWGRWRHGVMDCIKQIKAKASREQRTEWRMLKKKNYKDVQKNLKNGNQICSCQQHFPPFFLFFPGAPFSFYGAPAPGSPAPPS